MNLCVYTREKGRRLIYLALPDGRSFNELLVARGFAVPLTIAPNDRSPRGFASSRAEPAGTAPASGRRRRATAASAAGAEPNPGQHLPRVLNEITLAIERPAALSAMSTAL